MACLKKIVIIWELSALKIIKKNAFDQSLEKKKSLAVLITKKRISESIYWNAALFMKKNLLTTGPSC